MRWNRKLEFYVSTTSPFPLPQHPKLTSLSMYIFTLSYSSYFLIYLTYLSKYQSQWLIRRPVHQSPSHKILAELWIYISPLFSYANTAFTVMLISGIDKKHFVILSGSSYFSPHSNISNRKLHFLDSFLPTFLYLCIADGLSVSLDWNPLHGTLNGRVWKYLSIGRPRQKIT